MCKKNICIQPPLPPSFPPSHLSNYFLTSLLSHGRAWKKKQCMSVAYCCLLLTLAKACFVWGWIVSMPLFLYYPHNRRIHYKGAYGCQVSHWFFVRWNWVLQVILVISNYNLISPFRVWSNSTDIVSVLPNSWQIPWWIANLYDTHTHAYIPMLLSLSQHPYYLPCNLRAVLKVPHFLW